MLTYPTRWRQGAHNPPVPIASFAGLLFGNIVHDPSFDHVLTTGEFVEVTADRLFTLPAVKDDTFHVTIVFVAAITEPVVTPPSNPATINAMTRKIAFDRMSGHNPPN